MRRCLSTLLFLAAAPLAPGQTSPEVVSTRRPPPRLALPALGENAIIRCERLVFEATSERLEAVGSVVVRSDRFNIDCENLTYDGQSKLMVATGRAVQVATEDISASGGALTYNTETGAIAIRRASGGAQPQLIQQGDDSTFTAIADVISISVDSSGQSRAHFEGDVHVQNTVANAAASTASRLAAPQIRVEIPGMGSSGVMTCSSLVYRSATGDLTAGGGVIINTPDLFLDCQDFDYSQTTGRMVATGETVYLKKQDVESRCTRMTYLTDAGRIFLDRNRPGDPQPEVWQNREDEIFHAVADQITMTEMPEARTRVAWNGNVMVETLPVRASAEAVSGPQVPEPARPIESIDELPDAQVDPFA